MEHPPNILLIMDDQHRYDYLGIAGNTAVQTPNLDQLGARGTYFTHCITNAPVCAPARIGLATGLNPAHIGALDNKAQLPATMPTMYQRLRDHGYWVGCVGKLDLMKADHSIGPDGNRPAAYQWGFTHPVEFEGKSRSGKTKTPIGPYTYYLEERGLRQTLYDDYQRRRALSFSQAVYPSGLPEDAFADIYLGRRAVEWIDTIATDFPWFLTVNFLSPHTPFDPPAAYAERYRSATIPPAIQDSLEGKPNWIRARAEMATPAQITHIQRHYAALVELIDHQVGQLMAALERHDMLDNTIVIFASDHGEMLGDHGLYKKRLAYESSLRVPLLVAGPGIQAGQTTSTLVELIDLNPTICDLAGLPAQANIAARSIVPVLRGQAVAHRTETLSAMMNFRCLRTATHKLIENYNDVTELYDLENDPHERHNIASSQPDLLGELEDRLEARWITDQKMR